MTVEFSLYTAVLSAINITAACTFALTYIAFTPLSNMAYRWWASAFLLFSLQFVSLAMEGVIGNEFSLFLSLSFQAIGAVLLLYGTFIFFEAPKKYSSLAVSITIILSWAAYFSLWKPNLPLLTSPLYILPGLIYVYSGVLVLRKRKGVKNAGYALVGVSFILLGIDKLDYPLLGHVEWFTIYGFMISQLLMILIGIGLIYLSQNRQNQLAMQARQDLETTRERYMLAINGSNDGIMDWDIPNHQIYVSSRMAQLMEVKIGHGGNFIHDTQLMQAMHPDDRKLFNEQLIKHLRGDTDFLYCELRIILKDGREAWRLARGLGLRDEHNRVYRFAGSISDINDFKQQQDDLRMAKEAVEIASRSKTEFLANMSHELRTPLNSIIGFSDILKAQSFGPIGNARYLDYASTINMAGKHLLSLITDILDVAKIEAGQAHIEESNLDLVLTSAACIKLVQERATDKGINLRSEVAKGLPSLFADEVRLKQIIINLLTNAIKFTPQGGRVTLKIKMTDSRAFMVEVIDTGHGIAAKDIPKALSRFGQIGTSYTRHQDGVGIGLSLVQMFAALHNASFVLESSIGKGTTARVLFPVERTIALNSD